MESGIKELIMALNKELIQFNANKKEAQFIVEKLKIEASFIVEKNNNNEGGFNLKIINYGQDFKENRSDVHKITLELKSTNNFNTSISPINGNIKNEDFEISPIHTSIH